MCVDCEEYETPRRCGIHCSDHVYQVDGPLTEVLDDEEIFYRCPRCGSCRIGEGNP